MKITCSERNNKICELGKKKEVESATNSCNIASSNDFEDVEITEDVIEASEEYDTNLPDDLYEYINDLQYEVDKELRNEYDLEPLWDDDDENLYLTVTRGDEVYEFTIPIEDLQEEIGEDMAYIVNTVTDEVVVYMED